MPKKKKLTKPQRREVRLQKARQWVLTYEGKHIVRAYRKRFKVDYSCALSDLGAIGALQPEKLAAMQQAEKARLEKRRKEREAKYLQDMVNENPFSDDRFYFIAGYTSGGAPYGITWEEMGMEPWEVMDMDKEEE